ncbi:MAG: type III pantothenate kinase [Christensenellaceae bacterium]|nr:type III pantothenate kinase [Christensenellaceae bacterium]MEA5066170.1 type III pantothenate kinase [Eubacteriales bacterium]MEA5070275.1 type III pantothenate kinase [Christensenellaceae bacterium]
MILTLDIGNTNIKTALFEGEELLNYWRISTNRSMSSDEYGMLLNNLFTFGGRRMNDVTGIVMSSVVPTINFTIDHMCRNYLGRAPMMVGPGIKTGINIKYENARELGSDRIANAVAAYHIYGGPCIFIDFGTATSFGVVNEKGEFLGGAICPGIKMSSEALVEQTAKLPRFELMRPETVIGKNTITNMQSGIVYGHVGMVNYLVRKMKEELGAPSARVIATGGLALLLSGATDAIDVLDGLLTLKGLRIVYEKNTET